MELARPLGTPVWQEPFGARAGFPQDHPSFAGHLPAGRSGVRTALAGHDVLLVVGAPVLRQNPWEAGELVPDGMTVLQVTQYPDEAHHSVADVALIAEPAEICRRIAEHVRARGVVPAGRAVPQPLPAPEPGDPLRPAHVFDVLAELLPHDAVLVEESPSSRPELHRRVPARAPLGFVSAAAGGLGFGLPATIGLKLGAPRRPVVAVLGDGSSLYGVQGLWSAEHYQVGALYLVLSNGRYAIMDRARRAIGTGEGTVARLLRGEHRGRRARPGGAYRAMRSSGRPCRTPFRPWPNAPAPSSSTFRSPPRSATHRRRASSPGRGPRSSAAGEGRRTALREGSLTEPFRATGSHGV